MTKDENLTGLGLLGCCGINVTQRLLKSLFWTFVKSLGYGCYVRLYE